MSFYFVTLQLTREWDIKFFFTHLVSIIRTQKSSKKKKKKEIRTEKARQSKVRLVNLIFLFFAITTTLQYYSSCKLADSYSPKLTTNHKGL